LFTVGAAFSVYDGVHKMLNPGSVHSPLVAFAVLILSAVLEGFSLRTGIREANRVRGGRNWGAFIRRSKAPELPVVLLEDMAALIGLVFAFAGVALSVLTSNSRWDGAGSLGIGVLLATAAAILAVEMKSLLIGESASPEMQRMIIAAIEDGPDLARVIHLRTVHISPDSVLVVAKVAVRESDSATQITSGIDAAENRVRAAVPIAKTIYLEPDIYRPSMADQTDPSIRTVVRGRPPRLPRRDRPQPPSLPAGTAGNRTRNRYVASLSCWPCAGIRRPFRGTSTQESHVAHEPRKSNPSGTRAPLERNGGQRSAPSWGTLAKSGILAAGQQPERAFLLEVQRPARGRGNPAEPAAQVRDGGAHRRLGQHAQPERERRGADVVAPLELERDRDRFQVRLAELPVRRPAQTGRPRSARPGPRPAQPRRP